jgi:glucose-1-phosphate cytidylyltransferase
LNHTAEVTNFEEKPPEEVGWIIGGFFVLDKRVVDLIVDDDTSWEREPLETLAKSGELMAFKHEGFWQPVDTLRDKRHLDQLWAERKGPWLDRQEASGV